MATAANVTKLTPVAAEATPAPAPGSADFFAALIADAGAMPAPSGEVEQIDLEDGEAVPGDIDLSVLLPMLEQQRVAAPVPTLVQGGAPAAAPEAMDEAVPTRISTPTGAKGLVPTPPGAMVEKPDQAESQPAQVVAPAPVGPVPQQAPAAAGAGDSKAPAAEAATPMADTATPAADAKMPAARPAAETVRTAAPADAAAAAKQVVAAIQSAISADSPNAADPVKTEPAARAAPAAAPDPAAAAAAVQAGLAPQPPVSARAAGRPAPITAAAPEGLSEMEAAPNAGPTAPAERPAAPLFQPAGLQPASAMSSAAPSVAAPAQSVGTAIAEQVLDLARGSEWIEELARDIVRVGSSEGIMRFRLAPETLGELRVEIMQSERGAHIRLNVGSEAAQQALADAQPKLVSEARTQGVRIAEAEVSFTGGQTGREAGRQAQAQPDQTVRAARATASHPSTNDAAGQDGSRRHDRYA